MSCGRIEAQGTFNEISKKDSILHILPAEETRHSEQDIPKDQDPSIKLLNKESDGPEEEKETQERGTVNFKLYTSYLKSIESLPLVIYVIILKLFSQVVTSYIDYFVAEWVNWEESLPSNGTFLLNETISNAQSSVSDDRKLYIYTYSVLMLVFVILIFNAEFSFFYAFLRASRNLHDKLFHGVSNTFMSFFNKNSSGRILNRFSNDIGNIDTRLPEVLFGVTSVIIEFMKDFVKFINNFMFLVLFRNFWSYKFSYNRESILYDSNFSNGNHALSASSYLHSNIKESHQNVRVDSFH